MKATLVLLLALLLGISAQANVYTFTPDPIDLWDLSHGEAYTWGIGWEQGEEIFGARLIFTDIYDWIVEDTDSLYIHLLDDAPLGASRYNDYNTGPSDYFAGQGFHLDTWSDPVGGVSHSFLVYDFTAEQLAALNGYALDGAFGFGFDPDCHYFNGGIQFEANTSAVPEPATMVLFGLGLAGVGLRRRFKK